MKTAVQKYVKRGNAPKEHVLSVDALYAANRALYELIEQNGDLTCRTLASNEAGDEIKYAFEGAFRGMTADEYASKYNANSGGSYDALHDLLETAPRTLEELEMRLQKAARGIVANAAEIMDSTATKQRYITSERVLTPDQYVVVVNQIKDGIIAAARTARLPEIIDVDATEVGQDRPLIGR